MMTILKSLLLVLAALCLMGFDARDEETDELLMPAPAMFGYYGDTPDVEAIKAHFLNSFHCVVPVKGEGGLVPPIKCPQRGHEAPMDASAVLSVTPLGDGREGLVPGVRCSKWVNAPTKGIGFGFTQECNAYGYRYLLRMDVHYGVEA